MRLGNCGFAEGKGSSSSAPQAAQGLRISTHTNACRCGSCTVSFRRRPGSGWILASTGHQSLDQQIDALTAAGVNAERVYNDKLSGTSTREQRPGLGALLDYARPGDAIVVVGIDRLGRNAAEVMLTIRQLGERDIVLRSLREGIDTSNATGRMVAGVLVSLAELELELGRERRVAAREARRVRGQPIGRPKALDASKAALAQRMHDAGESASTIATTLGVSRATVYRVLAEQAE
jgi:DNA invertase Pin-like site-specific DNA recombinase